MISSLLQAQQDTTLLDEVVVTANKFPNKTSLTGKVVLVITQQQLEKSGGKDLSQILTEQAGIYIGGANSNPGKDKSIYIRGAGVTNSLITIDGVPVYDPSGIGNNFDIRNISINQVERIEILTGSQSTLYGSDAVAGVINIITKKNIEKNFSANGLLSYGSYHSLRGNGGINGKTGIVDYNLNYAYFDTKGISEAISTDPNADKDGYTQNSLQGSLGLHPNKKVNIQSYIRYNKNEGDIDQGAFVDELDYTYKQNSYQAGLINEFDLGKSKLKVLYNYNSIDRLYIDDSVKSRNGFDTYTRGSYKGKEHFIDAYITVPVGKYSSKLIAGADFRSSNSDQEYFSTGFFGPYTYKYSSDSLHHHQLGFYSAIVANSRTGFNIELGNRLNFHSEYRANYVFNINPSYLLNNKIKFFANLSSGFKTPSLYQLFSEYGNRELKPESSITAEAGAQYFSPNRKFDARVTMFNREIKNVLFFYFNPVTYASQYINQDKQKDHGAELELNFVPVKNVFVKTFYSFVDGKISTVQNGKDTTYFNLLRRPKHSAGINVSVNITDHLFVSVNSSWIGKREDAYFDAQSFQTVNVTLDSYLLVGFYAEYSILKNKIKLFADLRNITNAKFNEVAGFNTPGLNGYGGFRFIL